MDDQRVKHLEFIQNIITRHNANSFQIKIVLATIVSALLAFCGAIKDNYTPLSLLGALLICVFWFLDSFYLRQERLYRNLYEKAVKNESPLYSLSTEECSDKRTGYKSVLFSTTLMLYYGAMLSIFIIVMKTF